MDPASARYTIRINGHLGATILLAFPALVSRQHGAHTLLTGVLDRSALYGVLAEIEALGLDLLELRQLAPQRELREFGDSARLDAANYENPGTARRSEQVGRVEYWNDPAAPKPNSLVPACGILAVDDHSGRYAALPCARRAPPPGAARSASRSTPGLRCRPPEAEIPAAASRSCPA